MGTELDGRTDQYALAATAFHLLTGAPPFQNSNPAVVISQHLSAEPPVIGTRHPELASLDPVFSKALAKDPASRYQYCGDFARALRRHLDGDDPGETKTWVTAAAPPPAKPRVRAAVVVPAVLTILLVAAVGFALLELTRADDERAAPVPPSPATSSATPSPTPTSTTTTTPDPAATSETAPATTSVAPATVVVIGADCSPAGSTGTTESGATAYCSTLQDTSATIWSLNQGVVPSPTVTVDPTEQPLPIEQETPVRVCMEQTGQTRRECRGDILRSNGLP